MECSICYENFFIPKTREEVENKIKEIRKNKKDFEKFKNLLITSKHNTSYICSTPNCESLICRDCWTKIKFKDVDLDTFNYDNVSSMFNTFICPYCRKPDWKDYMNDVFMELRLKLLSNEEIASDIFHEF